MIAVGYPLAVFVRGRRLALGCVALALAPVLAGCGGGGSKPVSLPTLPSSSSSPSPSATASEEAAAAAVALVREYFALKADLSRRMEAGPLSAIETSDCICRKFLASIHAAAAAGNRYFGSTTIRALTPTVDSTQQVEVLVLYDTSAGGTKSADGKILFKGPPRTGVEAVFTLRLVHGQWLVADIATIKPGTT